MGAPYSQDLRDRVALAVATGSSARAAAARFGISESTAIRWAQRLRVEGHVEARPMGGDHRARLTGHREALLTLMAKQPDLTLAEIRTALIDQHAITVGVGTVWRFLAAHKITLKKKACTPPSSSGLTWLRPDGSSFADNRRSTPGTWCSSTRLPRPRR